MLHLSQSVQAQEKLSDIQDDNDHLSWWLNSWWFDIGHSGNIFTPWKSADFANQGGFVFLPKNWLPSTPLPLTPWKSLLPSNRLCNIPPETKDHCPIHLSNVSLLGI